MTTGRMNLIDLFGAGSVNASSSKTNSSKEEFGQYLQEHQPYEKNIVKEEKVYEDGVSAYEKLGTGANPVNDQMEVTSEPVEEHIIDEQLNALEEEIHQLLREALGITQEELDEILSQVGIPAIAMLDIKNLQTVIVAAKQVEPIALLTDVKLQDTVQQLSEAITLQGKEILGEEQFKEISTWIQDMPEMTTKDDVIKELVQYMEGTEQDTSVAVAKDAQVVEYTQEAVELLTLNQENPEGEKITSQPAENMELAAKVTVEHANLGQHMQEGKQQQTKSESQDVAQTVFQGLSQHLENVSVEDQPFIDNLRSMDTLNQVVEHIKIMSSNSMNSMEVQLYPEHLGKVQIQVALKDGVMHAQIITESEAAKAALETQVIQLKEHFEAQGMKVQAVDVSVDAQSFMQQEGERRSSEEHKQGKRTRREIRIADIGEDLSAEELQELQMLKAQGASVEFTA